MDTQWSNRHDDIWVSVTNHELLRITEAGVGTNLFHLNTAVISFTVIVYICNKLLEWKAAKRNLNPFLENLS